VPILDKVGKYCRGGQATDDSMLQTHSEYVILIAFPLRQSLGENAATLHYGMYVGCLVALQNGASGAQKSPMVLTIYG